LSSDGIGTKQYHQESKTPGGIKEQKGQLAIVLGTIEEHPRLKREFLRVSVDRGDRCKGGVATVWNGSSRIARCGRIAEKFGGVSALRVSGASSDRGHWLVSFPN